MRRAFVQEEDVDSLEGLPERPISERRHRDWPDAKRTCSRCSQRSLHRCIKRWPIALHLPLRDEIFATGLPGARRRGSYQIRLTGLEVRFGTAVTIMRDVTASRLSGLSARMKPILPKARSHMYRHWRKRCSGNVWATLSELALAKPRLLSILNLLCRKPPPEGLAIRTMTR
jgi:hypothetical protein